MRVLWVLQKCLVNPSHYYSLHPQLKNLLICVEKLLAFLLLILSVAFLLDLIFFVLI